MKQVRKHQNHTNMYHDKIKNSLSGMHCPGCNKEFQLINTDVYLPEERMEGVPSHWEKEIFVFCRICDTRKSYRIKLISSGNED